MKIITDPVELTKELIKINSESGDEQAVAEYIFNYLENLGLKPQYQKIEGKQSNVFLIGKGEVMFNGHMDIIPIGDREKWDYDPYGEIKDGKLFGRGTCDTKGSIACFLSALAKNPTADISCAFTVEEENTFAGIKNLMKMRNNELKHIKYCVNLEPTELKILTAHKGQMSIILKTTGVAVHSSVPEQGENAITKMSGVITAVEKFRQELKEVHHPLMGSPSLNIGTIHGGTAMNVVPAETTIEIDIRTVPNQDIDELIAKFTEIAKPAETTILHSHNPVELNSDSEVIKTFQKILEEKNLDSTPIEALYTTEFSELAEYDIEGLVFGAGSVDQAHNANEFVEIKQLELGHDIISKFLSTI